MATSASYASATIGPIATLDCNHPYFLHPSDNPGMLVTTETLTESNYNQWHRSMEIALSSKLKFGFVDGSYVKPAATSNLHVHWLRCNNMVTSWLLNTVSPEIRSSIVYMQSAREIWLDLATRYAQSNVPKVFNLRKDISHLAQSSLSISAYFTKFRTINDELECVKTKTRCVCNLCTCHVNTKLNEEDESVQLSQFLMAVSYTHLTLPTIYSV